MARLVRTLKAVTINTWLSRTTGFWHRISLLVGSVKEHQNLTDYLFNHLHKEPAVNFAYLGSNNTGIFATLPPPILGGLLLWAVPKKRTSHSKKRMRMTHKYLKPKHHYTVCPKCKNLKLLHVLCGHCLKETLRLTAMMRRKEFAQKSK